jgi:hypothetical protein
MVNSPLAIGQRHGRTHRHLQHLQTALREAPRPLDTLTAKDRYTVRLALIGYEQQLRAAACEMRQQGEMAAVAEIYARQAEDVQALRERLLGGVL